jgi:hypothetical protein
MATKSQIFRKDQIISALIEARQNILDQASRLSDTERDQIFLGMWSVKDLLAHLAGWDDTNLESVKSVLHGKVPSFYEYYDHDWQTYNAILVKKYKKDSFQELFATIKDSQEKLIEYLQTIPAENFNNDFGVRFRGYKVTIQRLLEAEAKDEQIHYKQITDFFREAK